MGTGRAWTEDEKAFLVANWAVPNDILAEKFGRPVLGIRHMRTKLGPPEGFKSCGALRPTVKWTQDDLDFIYETLGKPLADVCGYLGRSKSSVTNARLRVKREHGFEIRKISKDNVPRQDLWDRPPGVYAEIIGCVLIEMTDCMDAWMHAHGYSSFEISFEDPTGWTTVTCVKER